MPVLRTARRPVTPGATRRAGSARRRAARRFAAAAVLLCLAACSSTAGRTISASTAGSSAGSTANQPRPDPIDPEAVAKAFFDDFAKNDPGQAWLLTDPQSFQHNSTEQYLTEVFAHTAQAHSLDGLDSSSDSVVFKDVVQKDDELVPEPLLAGAPVQTWTFGVRAGDGNYYYKVVVVNRAQPNQSADWLVANFRFDSTSDQITIGPAAAAPSTEPTNTPSPTPAAPALAATGHVSDAVGNKASFTISYGPPAVVSNISDPAAAVCNDAIAAAGSSPDRSIAVPISATVTTQGTQPTTVVLRLGDVKEVTGQAGIEPPTDTLLWAKAYGSGPVCGDSNDITAANIRWDNIAPGFTENWHGWLILPNSMSTDDPTGTNGTLSRLLLSPDLVINDEITYPTYTAGHSPNLVTCTDADGTSQWLAINPAKVKSLGCVIG